MKRKKYSKIVNQETRLTPQLAKEFLASQIEKQRKVSQKYVDKYAYAIKQDLWRFDGGSIRIDCYGRMVDGQHRCLAVIAARKSIKIFVVYGVPPETFFTVDVGKSRTQGDSLRFVGEKNGGVLAGALNLLHQYATKKYIYGGYTLQNEEAVTFLKKHPRLRKAVRIAGPAKPVLELRLGTFLYYIFSQINHHQADEFFDKLATGVGLKSKDPLLVLRAQLIQNKIRKVEKMRRPQKISIIIKAWNAFRKGDSQSRKFTWRGSEKTKNESHVRAI